MNETIKRRLRELEQLITPKALEVVIENEDGTRERKSAVEWWEHRQEWELAGFDDQDNGGGLVVLLMFAKMFDDGAAEARANGNVVEAEYEEKERDAMLKLYFGDDTP